MKAYIICLVLASVLAYTNHPLFAGLVAFLWWITSTRPHKITSLDSRRKQVAGDSSGKNPGG